MHVQQSHRSLQTASRLLVVLRLDVRMSRVRVAAEIVSKEAAGFC
jgi:hypothetical protein